MYTYILIGAYSILITLLFGYLAIFVIHIKDFLVYSRYLGRFLRIYLLIVVGLSLFGGYKILTDSSIKGTQTYTNKGEY